CRDGGERCVRLYSSLPTPGPGTSYPTGQSLLQFYDNAGRGISALPGVQKIGWTTSLPYGTSEIGPQRFEIVGDPPVPPGDRPLADFQASDPGYFTTLDLPVTSV